MTSAPSRDGRSSAYNGSTEYRLLERRPGLIEPVAALPRPAITVEHLLAPGGQAWRAAHWRISGR